MPPMLGSMERKGAITGSEICQISSIAGCRLPGATQLTMIIAVRMKKYRLTKTQHADAPRQQVGNPGNAQRSPATHAMLARIRDCRVPR